LLPASLRDLSAEDLTETTGVALDGDDRVLDALALAPAVAGALALAATVQGVDALDVHIEDLLDGDLDVALVGARVDLEGVLALAEEGVALLRDDRLDDDVARVGDGHFAHAATSCSVRSAMNASMAASLKSMSSLLSTS